MANDFNLTLSMEEVWEDGKYEDPISDYFKSKFEEVKLMDIVPDPLFPTWSNGGCGKAGIAKRLECFLMAEDICEDFGKFRTWAYSLGISNHKEIILQIDFNKNVVNYPFKFNQICLEDQLFCEFVKERWSVLSQT